MSLVGPVLQSGTAVTEIIISVIQETNKNVELQDRDAYIRVLVPNRCVLSKALIEERLGTVFRLPSDLEAIMPSFRGKITFHADEVTWEAEK